MSFHKKYHDIEFVKKSKRKRSYHKGKVNNHKITIKFNRLVDVVPFENCRVQCDSLDDSYPWGMPVLSVNQVGIPA